MRVNEIPGVKGGMPFVGKGGLPVLDVQDIMNNGLEMPDGSTVRIWRNPDPGFNPSEPKFVIGGENPWGQGAERSLEASEEAETREQYENFMSFEPDMLSQNYINTYENYAHHIPDQFKDELNPDTVKATALNLRYIQDADMDYASFRNMDAIYDVVRQEIVNDLGDDANVSDGVVDLLANKRMFDKPAFTAARFDVADSMGKGNDFMDAVQLTAKSCEDYESFRSNFDDEGCERFMENLGIELPSIDDPALKAEYIDAQLEVYYNDMQQQPTLDDPGFDGPGTKLPGFNIDRGIDPNQYKPIAMTPNGDPIYRNPDPQKGEPMFSIGGENPWDPTAGYQLPSPLLADPTLAGGQIDFSDFAEDAPVYENQPAAPSVVPENDTPEYDESEFEESTPQNNGYSGYGY